MQSLREVLSHHPFLADLDAPFVEMLISCGTSVRFERNEYLARQGEPADAFYLIEEGEVLLETHAPHGSMLIDRLGPGDALGWSWLVAPHCWHFDARAAQPVNAVALDGRCVRTKCELNHELGFELLKRFSILLAHRVETTRDKVAGLHGVPVG